MITNYSTTRLLTTNKPVLRNKTRDIFNTQLFLSSKDEKTEEGGLRTCYKYKRSYSDKPLITVITVVFNGENYLEKTILSVIEQTYDNVEYIIIDGGSDDGTLEIINRYSDRIDYWISQKDDGIYDAMNKGISLSTGDVINLLNGGDTYYNSKVLTIIAKEFNCYSPDLIYSKVQVLDESGALKHITGKKIQAKDFIFKMPICHQSIFYSLSIFKKIGLYRKDLLIVGDHEWMIRFYKNNGNAYFLDLITVNYSAGGFSVSIPFVNFKEKFKISKENYSLLLSAIIYFLRIIKYYITKINK